MEIVILNTFCVIDSKMISSLVLMFIFFLVKSFPIRKPLLSFDVHKIRFRLSSIDKVKGDDGLERKTGSYGDWWVMMLMIIFFAKLIVRGRLTFGSFGLLIKFLSFWHYYIKIQRRFDKMIKGYMTTDALILFFLFFSLTLAIVIKSLQKKWSFIPFTPTLFITSIVMGKFSNYLGIVGDSLNATSGIDPRGILLIFLPPLIF